MNSPHTFLVDPVEEARGDMARALDPTQVWIGHDSLPQLAQALDQGGLPAVVLLGPGIVHDDAIMLAESVREERLPVRIIQFAKALDPDRLRDALRAGVADVVEVGAEYEEVRAAVAKATKDLEAAAVASVVTPTEQARPTPVVAVVAGKGGVGSSLVTTNLAVSLADRGHSVTLVDLDVVSGDLAIMLQKRPSLTVLDALDRIDHMDADALDGGYLTQVSDHLRLLPAPIEGGAYHVATGPFLQLLELVCDVSEVVLVDVGAAHDATGRAVLGRADRVVVVTTREVTAVRGARRVLAELEAMGVAKDNIRLVGNMADAGTGLSTADLEKALKAGIDHAVPVDKHAAKSVNQGDPLVNRRRSKAGQALHQLADHLVEAVGLTDD